MSNTTATPSSYSEASIDILDGLDPVKMRPSQFTRTDCPLHIVQEVLDNAIDEVQGGHATLVSLTIHQDLSVTIEDNGRGIPVGLHPERKIPVVQAVFGNLYAGGKFRKGQGGAYDFSGGLHGVGVSVTNALSEFLEAKIFRDGGTHLIRFENGILTKPVTRVGDAVSTGTLVHFKPNPKYFDSHAIPVDALMEHLRIKSMLLGGIEVVFRDERGAEPRVQTFSYKDGLKQFFDEAAPKVRTLPFVYGSYYHGDEHEQFAKGEGAEWVFGWFEQNLGTGKSYVNMVPTPQHGTHVGGLRTALYSAIRSYAEQHTMLPKGLKLTADDVFKNVYFCLSARMLDPAFDNQTKDRLNSRDGVKLVETAVAPQLLDWMAEHPDAAKSIAQMAISNALARTRTAEDKPLAKRGNSVVTLPGKLAGCESRDPAVTELFLVEGDSAGGSAKQGRAKEFQAILPMRGKGLNAWEVEALEALKNNEINDISTAIGIDLHTQEDEVDWSRLRYNKVCIMADADVDGRHIQVLMLSLIYKHLPKLLERGHVFIAQAPLYRVDVEAAGKKRPAKKLYLMDESEVEAVEARLKKEGYSKWQKSRFKGLGEMNAEELWETTLNPETRRLLQVLPPENGYAISDETLNNLMSKGRADWRRTWLEANGHTVNVND